jgi:hypothetical protein
VIAIGRAFGHGAHGREQQRAKQSQAKADRQVTRFHGMLLIVLMEKNGLPNRFVHNEYTAFIYLLSSAKS